jgi:NADPH-dependent 2,4-dienoyl-CoA reductase/sulfur reductase-like enzyme
MRFLIVGGSDAGISAGLRAHELDPSCNITLVLADEYPNFSICGLPLSVIWFRIAWLCCWIGAGNLE